MENYFKPYCPCKVLNVDGSDACVVCGMPYDIDNEYNGNNPSFCSCAQPVMKSTNDICMICGKSLRDYASTPTEDPANIYCICVTMTRTNPDNTCEVCDKPKPADKTTIFCCCFRPTAINQEQICLVCGKPKYFRMENAVNCCKCAGKTKTNRDENCVVCGKPKSSDDAIKYCYTKGNCKLASQNRQVSCIANRVYCPLQNIQWCPWVGAMEERAQHCKTYHPRNFFEVSAAIHCTAHLRDYADLEYYTTEFVVSVYDRLFKCCFEINSKGAMKWSTIVLKKSVEDVFNETYRFYIEFKSNNNRLMLHLDALCVKENVTTFNDFATTAKVWKQHLRPFYDDVNHIQYRFFIVHLPYATPEANTPSLQYFENFKQNFFLPWQNPRLLEPTVYEDNCRCVKIYVDGP